MTFQNNLVQNNTTGGGSIYFFNKTEQYQAFTFKNNAYRCTGDFTNTLTDFAAWTTASNEQNSFVEQAVFITSSDLHLMEPGGLNAGLPVGFIATDADGITRSLTAPTIGTFEYEVIEEAKPEMEDVYPNPFVGYITVNTTDNGPATICDLSGKVVLKKRLTSGSTSINTSVLPKGIYLLKMGNNTVKIVK